MTKRRVHPEPRRYWSPEDDALLVELYPHRPTADIAQRLGRSLPSTYRRARILGLAKSAAYLTSPASGRIATGSNVGAAGRFRKGSVPANKGVKRPKGWAPGRMRETQFKKGVRYGVAMRLYKSVGAERISKDGYRERKISDDDPLPQRRWRAVHVLLWESIHGPLPPSHAVAFKNGDRADICIENLELITRAELMLRNTVHNLPKPVAQAVQLLGALRRQINRRTREHEEQNRRPA